MDKVLKVDFFDDVTIDEIYEELINYKRQGIIDECVYKKLYYQMKVLQN